MKANLLVVGFGYAVIAAAVAQAQGLTKPWQDTSPLSPQDRAIIQSTVERDIHGKPPGTVVNWTNPDGGHSGTIKLLSKSARHGMPCERIEYRITEPRSTQQHGRYILTSCRLPDGSLEVGGIGGTPYHLTHDHPNYSRDEECIG